MLNVHHESVWGQARDLLQLTWISGDATDRRTATLRPLRLP